MLEECRLKVGGDTGKGFFKLTASLYVPASRTAPISKKMRRSREDGVSPVGKFAETGQRMILLLAWCKGIPESAENLEIVYNAVNLHSLQFIMTGDYKLLMPSFGLMSCSSTHPCLYCANLLALNTVLDHLSKFWPGNLKEDLKKVDCIR